jgi:CRP/FNR family transcriptional regulator
MSTIKILSTTSLPSRNISNEMSKLGIREAKPQCDLCGLRDSCLSFGLTEEERAKVSALVNTHQILKKNDALYRIGEPFLALYAVRRGSLKTTVLAEDGREQISGYYMSGDIIGFDGIGRKVYGCNALALEDSEVCVMIFEQISKFAQEIPTLQHNLHQIMSQEIMREHSLMLLLGSMRGEERVAAFLVNLSTRYLRRGYSSTEFILRMTREEIGSYLGLKLETVSRLLSHFQQEGIIQVHGREIKITALKKLKALCGQSIED